MNAFLARIRRILRYRWARVTGGPPPNRLRHDFSIAILRGPSPLQLNATPLSHITRAICRNPAISFVADPFMVRVADQWVLFFEAMNWKTHRGVIDCATSTDLNQWTYGGTVLDEPFHLSYPHVFAHDGAMYMTAETLGTEKVLLYRAHDFPGGWEPAATLLEGIHADPTPFEYNGHWYMYTCPAPDAHDSLALFTAESLEGPWHEHPASPIITGDPRHARPAGRVQFLSGAPVRFAQDCAHDYGTAVNAFRITDLSPTSYAEAPIDSNPILTGSGHGWNAHGMHHIDAHTLGDENTVYAVVDGWVRND